MTACFIVGIGYSCGNYLKFTTEIYMNNILVLFAHPAFKKSNINKALRGAVEGLEGVTFHDLYAAYPDFLIDVEYEQALCEQHDVIVMQHPFYWYSSPAILKEWQDLVLEHGWAYGSEGAALHGKTFFQVLTAGGDADAYKSGGYNLFTVQELTSPFRATANLCGLDWLPPFAVLGVHRGLPPDDVVHYSEEYRRLLIAVRDGHLNMGAAQKTERMNANLDDIIKG